MGKKLDAINFCRIFDEFGEEAAKDTFNDVAAGRIQEETLEKYLYTDETKEDYTRRLREGFKDF